MDDDAAVASTSSAGTTNDIDVRSKDVAATATVTSTTTPVIAVTVTHHRRPSLRPSVIVRPRRQLDDVTIRESEAELRRVMKTVSDSFAECRRVASPTSSPPEGATRSSSAASDVSSTSDLMEHFMSELDLVFSDIMAEEDLKSFRHSMQTASEASSPVHDDAVRHATTTAQRHQSTYAAQPEAVVAAAAATVSTVVAQPSRSSAAFAIVRPSPSFGIAAPSMPVDVVVEPAPSLHRPGGAPVVPLAVLDEFAGVGGGAGFGTDSELDISAVPSIAASSTARTAGFVVSADDGRRLASSGGQCRHSNGPMSPTSGGGGRRRNDTVPPSQPRAVLESTAIVDTCVVDMNSNAKDRANTALQANSRAAQTAAAAANALRRYENWDPSLFDDDCYTSDVTTDGDDVTESRVNPMLEFAEQYFNVHPSQHAGYQSALVRTVNIVTRKSPSDSVPLEDLLRFTKSSTILTSHVRLIDTDNVPIACATFKDVHRYMRGNSGTSLTEKSPNCVVRTVISHCLHRPELRDELYCVLVRMTTEIPASVTEEQRCRLWTLFCLCAVSFSPSHTLRKYLIAHLRRVVRSGAGVTIDGTAPPAGQDSKQTLYAKYCLRHIASPRTQTRKFAPSNAEIEAMATLQPLVYRIHFLDSKTKAIAVECSETSADALCRVADKIGLQSTYGWALYESLPDHDRYIKSTEFLADIIADWEEKQRNAESGSLPGTPKKNMIVSSIGGSPPPLPNKSLNPAPVHSYGKLVMCKRFCQRVGDVADDAVELRLLYFQAVHYVVHLDEYQVPVSTSLHLAGLQAQVEFGNYDTAKMSRYAEPEEMLCQRVLLSDSRDWTQELAAAHKRYGKNKSSTEAMRKYLAVVSQFPLYGCTKVFAHYRGVWAYGVETIIAINYDGIKLISVQEKKLAVDLYYSEIEEIQLQERHGECHVIFQLRNSVLQGRQKTYLFECLELDELASLVECYSPVHATWTSRSGGSGSTSSWRIDHCKPVGDWHRLYDNILQCRRVLIQSGIVKHTMHEEVSFLRSAFNRISGRNCGSLSRHHRSRSDSPGLAEDVEASEQANQAAVHGSHWAFTKVPFKTSLLAGQTHDIEDIAVRMFNSSLVYCGLEFSAALDDMDLVVVVQTLLHKCMDNEGLCNECFLQLIKQTTDTKTGPEHRSKNIPLVESSLRAANQYWHMMTMATCVMLPPCAVILTYLRLHLRRYGMMENAEEGKFARFCAKSLYRTHQNRGRKYPPSYKEIMFVTKRQPIECRVYLADGHPMLIEFDSAATSAEVIQMVKAKAGMRLDAEGFALFQIVKEREEYIAPEVKLADCLYQWEKSSRMNHSSSSKDFKILFKKRMFIEPFVNLNDPVEIDLLYHQSVTDVFEQKIPLTKSDAIQLCALRAQAEYGDHGHANSFDYNTVVRILPRHLRELTSSAEIRAVHQTLLGTAPLIANVAFLEILKQWPLYGAILFEVSSSLEYLPKTVWLAVSQLGLHLMEYKGQNIYVTYTFDEIVSCAPANKSLTVTLTSDLLPTNTLVFFTSEGAQIVQLISDYREVLARRRRLHTQDSCVVDGQTSDDGNSLTPIASSARRVREHRARTATHKALLPTAARRREVMRSGVTRHRSPTSSPEHDIRGVAPLLTHVKNRSASTTVGPASSSSQPNRGHMKYQRVKDGSRLAARRSQFQNSRTTDSKHAEGIFE